MDRWRPAQSALCAWRLRKKGTSCRGRPSPPYSSELTRRERVLSGSWVGEGFCRRVPRVFVPVPSVGHAGSLSVGVGCGCMGCGGSSDRQRGAVAASLLRGYVSQCKRRWMLLPLLETLWVGVPAFTGVLGGEGRGDGRGIPRLALLNHDRSRGASRRGSISGSKRLRRWLCWERGGHSEILACVLVSPPRMCWEDDTRHG